jgi:hypothetical protein
MTAPVPTKKFMQEFEPKQDKVFGCFGFMRGRRISKTEEDLKVSRNPIFKEPDRKKSDER